MNSICVITPSYNQGKFIERTLRSVLAQNIGGLEYVVFDGGSKDETLSILNRYENQISWVSEPDRGQAHAVNKGILATKGEIIAWINSDDIYYPGALAKAQEYFAEHEPVDVLYGNAFHIDINDSQVEPYNIEPWDPERLKNVCFLCQPAVFFRRRVVERFGMLDETLQYCMDYEYWLRLAKGGAVFSYLPEVMAGSRLYQQNKTLSKRVPVHAEINDMLKKKYGTVPTRWVFNYAHVKVEELQVSRGYWMKVLLAMYAILASLRWNHGISKETFEIIGIWVGIRKPK